VAVDPTFQQGQPTRSYRLHVAQGYGGGTRLPLLLDLHGFGGSAQGEEQASGYDGLADRMGFLAVYGQGLGQGLSSSQGAGWASTRPVDLGIDELGYFAALLNQLQRQLCVDERRVYVTGFSNGGGMTEMLACTQVTGLRWDGCREGVSVVHYRWNGGGHGAPPEIDGAPANEVVWRFLAGYSLP
jgi:polyhydroxybutyrate depolymerase